MPLPVVPRSWRVLGVQVAAPVTGCRLAEVPTLPSSLCPLDLSQKLVVFSVAQVEVGRGLSTSHTQVSACSLTPSYLVHSVLTRAWLHTSCSVCTHPHVLTHIRVSTHTCGFTHTCSSPCGSECRAVGPALHLIWTEDPIPACSAGLDQLGSPGVQRHRGLLLGSAAGRPPCPGGALGCFRQVLASSGLHARGRGCSCP